MFLIRLISRVSPAYVSAKADIESVTNECFCHDKADVRVSPANVSNNFKADIESVTSLCF